MGESDDLLVGDLGLSKTARTSLGVRSSLSENLGFRLPLTSVISGEGPRGEGS